MRHRLALGVILWLGAGCASGPAGGAAAPATARYLGVVPCASCPAIRLDVTLESDGRYELRRTYVATRDGDRTFTGKGRWTIDRGTGGRMIYRLVGSDGDKEAFLKVADDELRVLGADDTELPPHMPRTLVRVDASGAREVAVGEADAARPIRLVAGQELVVRLPSNPTTGYRWAIVAPPDDVMLVPREGTYVQDPSGGRMGVGGVETWRMMGVKRGDGKLRFEYVKPWERGVAPARVVSYSISVR